MQEEKEKGNFWLSLATFIVNKRKAIQILFIIALIFCAVASGWTRTNQDITKYLPADSETRIGLDKMEEQFTTYGSAKVMVTNITYDDALELSEQLSEVEGVKAVDFDNDRDHYTGTSALFEVTFEGESDDDISLTGLDNLKKSLENYDFFISTEVGSEIRSNQSLKEDVNLILVLAVIIIVAVLLVSTKAFMEIPVLLITFGTAALLNKGTNFIFGTISSVTDSIAVVLQLALAIDYAIILCDRFMEEHELLDSEEAVKVALSKAIPEISASSLTTISGMVAMMFMHFRLGYDMGIVLVKAIVLSLISVFFLMPGVILIFANGIDRTHHRSYVPSVRFIGEFANLTKYIIPPVFCVFLVFAYFTSSGCTYVYDTGSVPSAKMSEDRLADQRVETTFGSSNQLVVMVPAGDYEKEGKILSRLEKMDEVSSVLGLANVSINDDYKLTDQLTPRDFAELTDLDIEIARMLYMAYAYHVEQYGPVFTGIDEYGVPLIDMFLFLYEQYQEGYVTLSSELDNKLNELYDTLYDAKLQLQGDEYSRFVLNLATPSEGDETYAVMDRIRSICGEYYDKSSVLLVGNSTSNYDLMSSFVTDNVIITILTALFVMLILFFTFQSAGLPVLLVLTIQGSIWINFSVPALQGQVIFFIAYLIVSAIQMGATIDYAIVISSRYLELKQQYPLKEAVAMTLDQAFPTIFTSGTILTSAGFLIGRIASDPTVASIGTALGRGTLISIMLVLLVLPQILLMGDWILEHTALTIKGKLAPVRDISGVVIVNGRIHGYVEGEIDAEITGRFKGNMHASIENRKKDAPAGMKSGAGEPVPALPGQTDTSVDAGQTERPASFGTAGGTKEQSLPEQQGSLADQNPQEREEFCDAEDGFEIILEDDLTGDDPSDDLSERKNASKNSKNRGRERSGASGKKKSLKDRLLHRKGGRRGEE